MTAGARRLGAIIAGGQSQRFGSDKAMAMIDGRPMIDHVIAALRPQVDELVICGRAWPGLSSLADYPVQGFGPLGGLCAALDHAARGDFEAVLTAPVDVLPVPANLGDLLSGESAAVFERQYLIGYWPVRYRDALLAHIGEGGRRAFRAWLDTIEVRYAPEPFAMHNVNFVEDMPKEI